MTGTKTMKNL